MNNIEELFVPYKESLALKELEFDEPCIARFNKKQFQVNVLGNFYKHNSGEVGNFLSAPLFSQAFKFFRDNYKLESEFKKLEEGYTFHCFKNQEELVKSISKLFDDDRKKYVYQTYEKAELECLKQLIKIVKNEK
jgi:hypothetical protein